MSLDLNEEKLISAIQSLPEHRAPKDLAQSVMSGITGHGREKSFIEKLIVLFHHKVTLTFSPVAVAAVASVILFTVYFLQHGFIPSVSTPADDNSGKKQSSTLTPDFVIGKTLLLEGAYRKSFVYLKRAVDMSPGSAEYHFWLGVNYWKLNDLQKERDAYLKAVALEPNHLMSHFYLGHSFLNGMEWQQSLAYYDAVLAKDSSFDQALYNKGIALTHLERMGEAASVWKQYLGLNQGGKWAVRAVQHLNAAGDFTYQICMMGRQKTIIGPFSDQVNSTATEAVLEKLGAALLAKVDLDLHIVSFNEGNTRAAKAEAKQIKAALINLFPQITPDRIKLSWFGTADQINTGNTHHMRRKSVRFIGLNKKILGKGASV